MIIIVGYLLIGVTMGIGAYLIGRKLDPFTFDGFGSFAVLILISAVLWVLILPIAILVAILFAIYWAVCTYITHDDIENPFDD